MTVPVTNGEAVTGSRHRRHRVWGTGLSATLLLVAALIGSALLEDNQTSERAPFTPRPAPVLNGPTLTGDEFDLSAWRGQVVVVNVWASWCAPCREEMPLLARTGRRLRDQGLRVVGINTADDIEAAREFLRRTRADFPHVVDTDGSVAVGWGTVGMPETYVVDRSGQIVARQLGAVSEQWIVSVVEPLLDERMSREGRDHE